jgi:hypothetical protein
MSQRGADDKVKSQNTEVREQKVESCADEEDEGR